MSIYQPYSAYAPREKYDALFMDPAVTMSLSGRVAETLDFITDFQLLHPDMWARFVRQFVEHTDVSDRGWRGEYWGKMMRGATFVYEVTHDPALFAVLRDTVADMMAAADADGRISSYTREAELSGWDLWCRKYVILGMQYFMDISPDQAFNARVLSSMEGQIAALMAIVGDRAEGKTPVTYTSNYWRGLNASSILEPVVRAYNLTGKQIYLDFAAHIVGEGFTQVDNLIDLALENQAAPYQYPITKAYEMSSCFMGLLEYYRVTGVERYKTAVEQFAAKVLETDFTIAGSGGLEHELFGHSTVRQANPNVGATPQETCVTVTLMQLFSQLALFTGDPKYLDAFERSLYNAYLGAVNTEKILSPVAARTAPEAFQEPLPFDSYSPLTAATRGTAVGGFKVMPDGHYYGCCACIGAAGIGLAGKMALLRTRDGLALTLYLPGRYEARLPDGSPVTLVVETDYPASEKVSLTLGLEAPKTFPLSLRIPGWCEGATLSSSGHLVPVTPGMTDLHRLWQNGDRVELTLPMPVVYHRPIPYGRDLLMNKYNSDLHMMAPHLDVEHPDAKRHVAFTRGPLLLAVDEALGADPAGVLDFDLDSLTAAPAEAPFPTQIALAMPLRNGSTVTLVDYASAGKRWDSRIAAWVKCE